MGNTAQIGTVISGTLRTEDLLEAFSSELGYLNAGYIEAGAHSQAYDAALEVDPESEEASELVIELMDALNEYAPPFCYFGSLEGDGADFGFWPDRDAIENSQTEGERDPERSWGGDTYIVNLEDGVTHHINDHGNLTITSNETGEVLLALV